MQLTCFDVFCAVETASMYVRAEDANIIFVGFLERTIFHSHW